MLKLIPLICGLIGLLSAISFYHWVCRSNSSTKNDKLRGTENANTIFHRKDWLTIIITIIVLSVATGVFAGWFAMGLYLYGAIVSILAEYLSSIFITRGTIEFAHTEDNKRAFRVSFRTGAAAGLFLASFGLLALGSIFVPFKLKTAVTAIAAYGFGASTIALFNDSKIKRLDDIYESYIESIISVIILSTLAVNTSDIMSTFNNRTAAIFPLIIAGTGVLCSIIGSTFVRGGKKSGTGLRINICVIISSVLLALAAVFLSFRMLQSYVYAVAIITGIICGILIGITSAKGLNSIPVLVFAVSIVVPYSLIGTYGVALAAMGFLSISSVIIAINGFVLVSGGTEPVTRLGNAYSTCGSALAVLAVFVAYSYVCQLSSISILKPQVLAGLIIGVTMPLVYVTYVMRSSEDRDYSFFMDLLAILIPVIIGITMGTETLGGMLGGLVASGLITSFIANTFDMQTGKENSISIVSSINTLIKYMTVISLVFAPVFTKFGGLLF